MTRTTWIVFLLFCLASAGEALACGICVFAATDLVLPPVHIWMLLALSWFLSNGVVRSVTGVPLPWQPKAAGAVGLAFLALIAAGAAFGPLTVLPLFLPPAYAFLRSMVGRREGENGVKVVGAVHAIAVAVAIAFTVFTVSTRTDAEYIARWPGSPTALAKLKTLRELGPASLPAYRSLLATNNSYLAAEAAEQIGAIGDPDHDMAGLMRAAERFRGSVETQQKIEAALQQLRAKVRR